MKVVIETINPGQDDLRLSLIRNFAQDMYGFG